MIPMLSYRNLSPYNSTERVGIGGRESGRRKTNGNVATVNRAGLAALRFVHRVAILDEILRLLYTLLHRLAAAAAVGGGRSSSSSSGSSRRRRRTSQILRLLHTVVYGLMDVFLGEGRRKRGEGRGEKEEGGGGARERASERVAACRAIGMTDA